MEGFLNGEDGILLSDDEAGGFWGPGMFLSEGPARNPSIPSRVAYWAGGWTLRRGGNLLPSR